MNEHRAQSTEHTLSSNIIGHILFRFVLLEINSSAHFSKPYLNTDANWNIQPVIFVILRILMTNLKGTSYFFWLFSFFPHFYNSFIKWTVFAYIMSSNISREMDDNRNLSSFIFFSKCSLRRKKKRPHEWNGWLYTFYNKYKMLTTIFFPSSLWRETW